MESYFNGIWKDTSLECYEYSGYSLVDYVNNQKPSSVLDVGCGYNRFKGKIKNLIGIDPYNESADIKVSIENYNTVPYDIALCLGSINFGDEETINKQIDKLHTLWRREAIFRVNPGIKHTGVKYENIEWYPWSQKKIYDIAKQYNYIVKDMKMEYTDKNELRYFFIYTK
tara:strand:- start:30 stop:539 length:510 start_codon:yes stop_codon:yes gene_type:complete